MQPNAIEVDLAQSMRRYRSGSLRLPTKILFGQWQADRFRLDLVHQTRDQIVSLKHSEWAWDGRTDSHDLGIQAKRWLQEEGIRATRIVISIPRRWAVLKTLTVPANLEADLAEVIALQAETLFPVARSTLEIDFVPLPNPHDDDSRRILVAAAPRENLQQLQQWSRAAGLKIAAISVGELCLPFLAASTSETTHRLNVLMDGSQVEFLLCQSCFPLISFQSAQPDAAGDVVSLVKATTTRMWRTLHGEHDAPDSNLSLHLFGTIAKDTYKVLADAVPEPIVWESSQDAGSIKCEAVLAAARHQTWSLDFHHPRKPRDRQRDLRIRTALIALAAMVLFVAAAIPVYQDHQELDRKIASVRKERLELASHIERLKPIERSWQKLVKFDRHRYNFAEETQRFMENLPASKEMFLESLELKENPNGIVSFHLSGKARSHEAMAAVTNQLLQSERGYRPKPVTTTPTVGDGDYSLNFSWEVELPVFELDRKE